MAFLLTVILLGPLWAADSYRVQNSTSQDIYEHAVCEKVNNASGRDLFVATKTSPEWLAFRTHVPAGVTLSVCDTIAPNAISDLTFAGRTAGSISLSWSAPYDNGTTITDYIIEYKANASSTWLGFSDGVSTNTFTTVTGLSASTSYDFRVAAYNGSTSVFSNVVTDVTAPNDPFFDPTVFNAMNCGGATSSAVVAMDDNTHITLNGTPLAGSPINAGQVLVFASAIGDVLSADKPIYAVGRLSFASGDPNSGNIEWNTPQWASTSFITVGSRNPDHVLTVYAFENTNVTITRGATVHFNNDPIAAGNFKTYRVANNAGYKITSTGLITIYQYSEDTAGNAVIDNLPLIPPDVDIVGIPSASGQYTTTVSGTAFNWYESDNTSGGTNLTEGVLTSYGSNGSNYAAPSARAISTVPILGRSNADSDGSDSAPFVPKAFMKRRFAIPHLAEWVAFASTNPTTIQVFTPAGAQSTVTLTRTGSGANTPYHGRLTNVALGTIFESDTPFQTWYESDEAAEISSEREDESIVVGDYGVDLPVNHKLKIWLDGKDANTLFQNDDCTGVVSANGQNVGCWRDKSRQGNNATQSGGNKPTFSATTSAFGGRPSLDFNGGTNYLNFDQSVLAGTAYTVFAVVHRDTTTANSFFMGTQSAVANQGLHLGFTSDTSATLGQFSNNISATVVGQSENSVGIFWGRLNTSSGKKIFFNNVTNTHATTTTLSSPGQGVIGRGYDTNGFDGQIAELIVYSRALSDPEVLLVQNYLMEKWLAPAVSDDLRVWFDSSDSSRLFTDTGCTTNVAASGDSVRCWKDQGGHNYLAKTSTGTPLWKADGTRNIVEFTNDSLVVTGTPYGAVFNSGTSLTAAEVFAVTKSASSVETGYLFHHPAGNRFSAHIPWSGNVELDLDAGGAGTLSAAWGGNTTNYFIWNLISDMAAPYQGIYRDTTLVSSDATASSITTGTENFYLGAQNGTSNFQNLNLASLVIYKKRLTPEERQMVRAYLKIKWNL